MHPLPHACMPTTQSDLGLQYIFLVFPLHWPCSSCRCLAPAPALLMTMATAMNCNDQLSIPTLTCECQYSMFFVAHTYLTFSCVCLPLYSLLFFFFGLHVLTWKILTTKIVKVIIYNLNLYFLQSSIPKLKKMKKEIDLWKLTEVTIYEFVLGTFCISKLKKGDKGCSKSCWKTFTKKV